MFITLISLITCLLSTICSAEQHDKWIVVTTIQYPTQALKLLAQLPEWRLVVVGDKKTPQDWHLDNCVYLSPQDQEQLPYAIIKHLPWNHYCRKNVGYLYAIEHGAQIIYETDDDNYILETARYCPKNSNMWYYQSTNPYINVYEHFGQPTVWPRGYPLNRITKRSNYTFEEQPAFIPIQQGLVNSDPDVDAIYRLTHTQEINFDSTKPAVALPKHTMCPFNSQNTLFYHEAFWGLLIPITTSFRTCDIWRGYWVQRMLWDINASLCFLPPTANQYRNEHNLLKDFADEVDVYLKAEELITTLNSWYSVQTTLADRIKVLFDELIKHHFFKQTELALVNAWLEDLQRLGYKMPEIVD